MRTGAIQTIKWMTARQTIDAAKKGVLPTFEHHTSEETTTPMTPTQFLTELNKIVENTDYNTNATASATTNTTVETTSTTNDNASATTTTTTSLATSTLIHSAPAETIDESKVNEDSTAYYYY